MTDMTDKPISLRSVIDELSMLPDEAHVYLDRTNCVFIGITDSQFAAAESEGSLDEYPDWERGIIVLACEVENSERYIGLPDKYELNEYQIMKRFCYSMDDPGIRDELLQAISGRGAFRMFRDAIRRHGLDALWYAYRDRELADIARSWLRGNGISFIDDTAANEKKGT